MDVVVNALIFELDYVDKSVLFSCTPKELQNKPRRIFLFALKANQQPT